MKGLSVLIEHAENLSDAEFRLLFLLSDCPVEDGFQAPIEFFEEKANWDAQKTFETVAYFSLPLKISYDAEADQHYVRWQL
jgi:hypothetical protein